MRETRSLENLKLLTICLLTASIVVCYQDVYTATFRKHRFRSLVRTQRLKCETGSQLLGPFRTAVSHFRRFAFRVSLSQFRDALLQRFTSKNKRETRCCHIFWIIPRLSFLGSTADPTCPRPTLLPCSQSKRVWPFLAINRHHLITECQKLRNGNSKD